MRAFRVAELCARRRPSRIVVEEDIFAAVGKYAKCTVIHIEGPLVGPTRDNPARFACIKGGPHAGRHFIAWQIGKEF